MHHLKQGNSKSNTMRWKSHQTSHGEYKLILVSKEAALKKHIDRRQRSFCNKSVFFAFSVLELAAPDSPFAKCVPPAVSRLQHPMADPDGHAYAIERFLILVVGGKSTQ